MTVEIKHCLTGNVMLSINVPDLRGAYLRGADLHDADLQGAYLRGAYLRGAYLHGADLHDADLRGADLRGADLQDADLHDADLRGAYLRGAYLRGADIAYCVGDGTIIRTMQTLKYHVLVCDDWVQIGCKGFRLHEWESFDDDEISSMDGGALEWWDVNKALVFAFVDADGMGES